MGRINRYADYAALGASTDDRRSILIVQARPIQKDSILSQEGPKSTIGLDVETRYIFGAYI